MDQFIREVDEEYRRERIAQIWARWGALIVVVAVLAVAGIGGWRYWEHRQAGLSEAAALRYDEALRLSRDGKRDQSEAVLQGLGADAPGGYRLLARFRLAAERGLTDPAAGAQAYDALADDATIEAGLRDLARLRAAMLRMDGADPAAAVSAFERLNTPTSPWRHTAREVLGLAALKRGDFDGASRWFDAIAQDRETPQNLRARLEIYTALAAGGPVQTTQ
jgi:hypothetical protein